MLTYSAENKKKSREHSSLTNIYLVCMYGQELALNNLEGLICRKIQPTNLFSEMLSDAFWLSRAFLMNCLLRAVC